MIGSAGGRERRVRAWMIAVLFLTVLPRTAFAETTRTIVVVRGQASQGLYDHVRNEIGALGWRVVSVEALSEGGSLEQAAREAQASAALQLSYGRADLWIANRDTGDTALTESLSVSDDDREDVVALRVVELLRARLLRLGFVVEAVPPAKSAAPSRDAPTPPPTAPARRDSPATAPATQEPDPAELWVGGSAVLSLSTGNLGPALHAEVRARWSVASWSLAVDALVPVTSAEVSAPAGAAEVRIGIAALTVDRQLDLTSEAKALLGATAAAVVMRSDGRAREGFEGRVDWVLVGAAMLHAGFWQRLTPSVALRFDARAGAALPRPVVQLDDRVEAWWGRPVVMGGVGFELKPF